MRKILIYFLAIFILNTSLLTQISSTDIEDIQKRLKSIQQEIKRLEEKLSIAQSQLRKETEEMENLDRQITLINNKIRIYHQEIEKKEKSIKQLKTQIKTLREKLDRLQLIFKRQIIFAYKYQRGRELNWILGASNLLDMIVRHRYFQIISKVEKNIYNQLKQTKISLDEKELKLSEEIESLNMLLAEANHDKLVLEEKRNAKIIIVNMIKNNNKLTQLSIQRKRESERKLLDLIARLEKARPTRKLKTKTKVKWEKLSGSFSRKRGKINWPVNGEILHKFGRYKNPQLKTVLNNSGIDIRAPRGSEVYCVFPGVVSLVTYMSGFGNTVIVDHNDGYYTVYAHLEEVFVNPDEFIESGSVIGTVGESGSLEGVKLHFEIYGNNKPLNPLLWLKKKQ